MVVHERDCIHGRDDSHAKDFARLCCGVTAIASVATVKAASELPACGACDFGRPKFFNQLIRNNRSAALCVAGLSRVTGFAKTIVQPE